MNGEIYYTDTIFSNLHIKILKEVFEKPDKNYSKSYFEE